MKQFGICMKKIEICGGTFLIKSVDDVLFVYSLFLRPTTAFHVQLNGKLYSAGLRCKLLIYLIAFPMLQNELAARFLQSSRTLI